MDREEHDDVKSDDSEDIYGDIGDFHLDKELTKLEESNKAYLADVARLSEKLKQVTKKNSELQNMNEILVTNISILLKTAKTEIERKQLVIEELRKKIDSTIISSGLNKDCEEYVGKCKMCAKLQSIPQSKSKNSEGSIKQEQSQEYQHIHSSGGHENIKDSKERRSKNSREKGSTSGNHRKKKRSHDRSRERSKDKYSSGPSDRTSRHGDDKHSYHSKSSRRDHRHHSDKRKKHCERRRSEKNSPDKEKFSFRSKHRNSCRTEYSPDKRRHSRDSRRSSENCRRSSSQNSSSHRKGRSRERKSGSKQKDEKNPREEEEKSSKIMSIKQKPLGKIEASNEQLHKQEEHEKKTLSIGEYRQRRNSCNDSEVQNGCDITTRQSVYNDLCNEPKASDKLSSNLNSGENQEEIEVTDVEGGGSWASSSDGGWSLSFERKTVPLEKPKTLYSRRMEARIRQQLLEEALSANSERLESERVEQKAEKPCNEEPTERNTPEKKLKSNTVESGQEEEKEEGEISNDEDEITNTLEDMKHAENEVEEEERKTGNGNILEERAASGDNVENEMTVDEKVEKNSKEVSHSVSVLRKTSRKLVNDFTVEIEILGKSDEKQLDQVKPEKICEQPFGEILIRKFLQLEDSEELQEIKEYSPLKNNYKLQEISPAKPVSKQHHILEYYSLKPAQQANTFDSEIFDLSFSVPVTPGKNFCPLSTLKENQESSKVETEAGDKLKSLFDKLCTENTSWTEEERKGTEETTEGQVVDEEAKSDGEKTINDVKTSKSRKTIDQTEGRQRVSFGESDKTNELDPEKLHNVPDLSDDCFANKNIDESDCEAQVNAKSTACREKATNDDNQERSYYLRTRNSKSYGEQVGNAKLDRDSKKNSSSVTWLKQNKANDKCKAEKSDPTKRKRKEISTEEEDCDNCSVAKRKKIVKKNTVQRRNQRNKKKMEETENSDGEQPKNEEKETETLGEITFEIIKLISGNVAENSYQSEFATDVQRPLALDDLSLSNVSDCRPTAASSPPSLGNHTAPLETPVKCAAATKDEQTPVHLSEDKGKFSSLTNSSTDSSGFVALKNCLMSSANDDSDIDNFSDSDDASSGDYSDSGASAFVDLLS